MDGTQPAKPSQERLLGDLREVIENAEELLRNTTQYNGTLYEAARTKLAEALDAATEELGRFEDAHIGRMMELTAAANRLHQDLTGEARVLRAFHSEG